MTEQTTNRNGVVGDFREFAPVRRSTEDLIRAAIAARGSARRDPPERTSREVALIGDHRLVRYHLGSDELRHDAEAVGGGLSPLDWTDIAHCSAILGLVHAETGRAQAVFHAVDDRGGEGPRLSFMHLDRAAPPPRDVLLDALNYIDIPATWRTGLDRALEIEHDLKHDARAGRWKVVEPRHVVVVPFERICFATQPTIREQVDVVLLPEAGHDLSSADAEDAYMAGQHYLGAAWERLRGLKGGNDRRGFSSWLQGKPHLAKVSGTSLDAEIEELSHGRDEAEPTPRP